MTGAGVELVETVGADGEGGFGVGSEGWRGPEQSMLELRGGSRDGGPNGRRGGGGQ